MKHVNLIAILLACALTAICFAGCDADDNEPEPCWKLFAGPGECIAPSDCSVPPECKYIYSPDFAAPDMDAVKRQLSFEKEGLNTLVIPFSSEPVGLTVEMYHSDPPESNSRLIGWRLDKTILTIELFCDSDYGLRLEWRDGHLTMAGLCGPI